MVGLPAAGKTTRAEELAAAHNALRLTPDHWMVPLFGDSMADGRRWVLEGRLISVALQSLRLGTSVVLDNKGDKFAELFESDQRRVWVPLSQMPEYVQRAFVAAEDKRFYQHKGIDERGLIRAFITNIAEPGRPQGGSTITQQVAKNLLVGDDVSYERKIREMIVASRIDQSLSKDEILEIYLNSIYLGRGAWGIDTAARSYFKKPAAALNVTEGAMLASMAKGPHIALLMTVVPFAAFALLTRRRNAATVARE